MTSTSPPAGLVVAHDGAVLRLTLDRPDRRNAVTDEIVARLIEEVEAAGNDEGVRVIVLAATGEHFCSGFDLATRAAAPGAADAPKPRVGATQRHMRNDVHRLIPTLLETQTPIVAEVRGYAIGLGLALALAVDFAIVADDARLRAPFTTMGFTPDSGTSWLIPRLVGVTRAKEMLLLGREISGTQAEAWGLVHRAVPSGDVAAATEDLVQELAASATVAVGLAKLLVHRSLTVDLERHLADEAWGLELSSRTDDFKEPRRAKRDSRDVRFRGR